MNRMSHPSRERGYNLLLILLCGLLSLAPSAWVKASATATFASPASAAHLAEIEEDGAEEVVAPRASRTAGRSVGSATAPPAVWRSAPPRIVNSPSRSSCPPAPPRFADLNGIGAYLRC